MMLCVDPIQVHERDILVDSQGSALFHSEKEWSAFLSVQRAC